VKLNRIVLAALLLLLLPSITTDSRVRVASTTNTYSDPYFRNRSRGKDGPWIICPFVGRCWSYYK
jgi:hypothetical protein